MNDIEAALSAMKSIPVFYGYDGPVTRLGGLTNLVFRAGDYCLRIPGKGTEEYINRANEEQAAREAARCGRQSRGAALRQALGRDGHTVSRRHHHHVARRVPVAAGIAGARRAGVSQAAYIRGRISVPFRALQHDR